MDERANRDGRIRLQPIDRHSERPLLFAPPQGPDALPPTLPPTSGRYAANDVPRQSPDDSYVRLRVDPLALLGQVELLEAQDLLDELCEDQLTLSMNLACLERAAQERSHDSSTVTAAMESLDARLKDLSDVRDALAVLQLSTIARSVHRAFLPDAPLADYVRGVYAWTQALLRALDELVVGIAAMQPDWATYRWRIEEANNFHFDELEGVIREDLEALFDQTGDEASVTQLAEAYAVLLVRARKLEERLHDRVG